MSTHITTTGESRDGEGPSDGHSDEERETLSGPQSIPRAVLLTGFLITALGGLTGIAAVVSALTGLGSGAEGDGPTAPVRQSQAAPPSVSPSAAAARAASVRIQYPQQAASVRLHQKVYGVAVIPPHHTLWLVAHRKGEAALNLLGRVHLTGPDTGPTSWDACPQIGDFPAQRGASFEIGAVLIPDATSDYLLGATTYTGVQLVPAKAGADVAGLVSTRLPPGTDTVHRASVWVTLDAGGENCSS
ncbi:hypothetical protein [Streptomyces griseorubiginosus]|uniref:hypothetical protein n=1 Tax=Streptomyces griseorubiginosus TaxID=67304 RepID=UPI00076D351B|nr:hypothetical protein [Streptomyces griseorubiginosus]KUM67850.1 hypothetical protein AQI84_39545 [Streptomyces griseorubiginosus]